MQIEQFEDKGLSQYSYAICSGKEIALIDPSRDIAPYLAYASEQGAEIVAVVETHPHADFISGHAELAEVTGAVIYCSPLSGAFYAHRALADGSVIALGDLRLKAISTPGHSPDSISIVLEQDGIDTAVFTGDTLFIGDCGRPDLREKAGSLTVSREELAAAIYHSLRKLVLLDDKVLVYPAHGAGSLCGKALSEASRSTIGAEKISNWSLQPMSEAVFIKALLSDQPFVPGYFPYAVELNRNGAVNLRSAVEGVPVLQLPGQLNAQITVVDSRSAGEFKKGHILGAINIQKGGKFETWLGSIIAPEEAFYLVAGDETDLRELILRSAKIGYEQFIEAGLLSVTAGGRSAILDLDHFKLENQSFTIVDVRNENEVREHPLFADAINIPLPELRGRLGEIPASKPVVVHCAGGYRSAAGSSIVSKALNGRTQVFDLGENVQGFFSALHTGV